MTAENGAKTISFINTISGGARMAYDFSLYKICIIINVTRKFRKQFFLEYIKVAANTWMVFLYETNKLHDSNDLAS